MSTPATTYINDNALALYPFAPLSSIPFGRHCVRELKATVWSNYDVLPEIKVGSASITETTITLAIYLKTSDAADDNPTNSNALYPWVYLGLVQSNFGEPCTLTQLSSANAKVNILFEAGVRTTEDIGSYICDLPLDPSAVTYVSDDVMGKYKTYMLRGMPHAMPQVFSLSFGGYYQVNDPALPATGVTHTTRLITITADVPSTAVTSIQENLDNYSMVTEINNSSTISNSADGVALVLNIDTPDTAPATAKPEDYITVKLDNSIPLEKIRETDPDLSLAQSIIVDTERTNIWEQLGTIRPGMLLLTVHGTDKFPNCYKNQDDASDIEAADSESIGQN